MKSLLLLLLLATPLVPVQAQEELLLARHVLTDHWGFRTYDSQDNEGSDISDYSFSWKIRKHFGGNAITWDSIHVNETMILTPDTFGPAFHLFTRLLTDGNDYVSSFVFQLKHSGSSGLGQQESFVFGDEPGSFNEIDLQGNTVESVSVLFDRFDLIPNATADVTPSDDSTWIEAYVNLTVAVYGRRELPGDRDLAIVTDESDVYYCPSYPCNSTVWFTVQEPAETPLWWAEVEFAFEINDNTTTTGMMLFPPTFDYGNRPIQQMLTSGVSDGGVSVGFQRQDGISESHGKSKHIKFQGLPGVVNGVDFEGSLVEGMTLGVERRGDNSLQLSFVISGVQIQEEGPTTMPPSMEPTTVDSSSPGRGSLIGSTVSSMVLFLFANSWL